MARPTHRNLQIGTLRDTETSSSLDQTPTIALTIAYHPQLDRIGQQFFFPTRANERVELSRLTPCFAATRDSAGEPLHDPSISRSPIYLSTTSEGGVCIEIPESTTSLAICRETITGKVKLTADDIAAGVVLALGKRIVILLHSIPPFEDLAASVDPAIAPEMIGTGIGLRRVLLEVKHVADTDKHVLLRGETGTGKELVAHAIHRASRRSKGPLEMVNIANVVETVAEAELFGVEEGAFTGAIKRTGFFERAAQGTIFLDEIGEIPSAIQAKLLRVLENGEIQPVGARKTRKVDVRVISATDANLENKIAARTFPEALYQRLKGYEIWLPPLRERREDIGPLFVHFLRIELAAVQESHRLDVEETDAKPWLSGAIVARIIDYDWPGNVRELKHAVGQMVIGSRGRSQLKLPFALTRLWDQRPPRIKPLKIRTDGVAQPPEHVDNLIPRGRKPADISADELRDALRQSRWDLEATRVRLGISRSGVYTLTDRFPWFRVAGKLTIAELEECHKECDGQLGAMAERLEVSETALKRRIRELGLTFKR